MGYSKKVDFDFLIVWYTKHEKAEHVWSISTQWLSWFMYSTNQNMSLFIWLKLRLCGLEFFWTSSIRTTANQGWGLITSNHIFSYNFEENRCDNNVNVHTKE